MTRMQGLRESFRVLGTVVRFTRWSTPIGLPAIRQELVRAVRPGSTEGRGAPREYEYPNLVEASADAKTCEAALRRVGPELHEHELWAFRIVLDEARASIARAKNLPPRR